MIFHRGRKGVPRKRLPSAEQEAIAFRAESALLRNDMADLSSDISETLAELQAFGKMMKASEK